MENQTEYKNKIWRKITQLDPNSMTTAERAVMHEMVMGAQQHRKVTQADIARSQRWLGCHLEHEADIARNNLETTTRKIRQVVRDLRLKYHIPILSDRHGYYFPRTEAEAGEYVKDLERKAKSQASAWYETYAAMKNSLNIQSTFFDQYAATNPPIRDVQQVQEREANLQRI